MRSCFYLFFETSFVSHDLSRDLSVGKYDDTQRHDPAPDPQQENEYFCF